MCRETDVQLNDELFMNKNTPFFLHLLLIPFTYFYGLMLCLYIGAVENSRRWIETLILTHFRENIVSYSVIKNKQTYKQLYVSHNMTPNVRALIHYFSEEFLSLIFVLNLN